MFNLAPVRPEGHIVRLNTSQITVLFMRRTKRGEPNPALRDYGDISAKKWPAQPGLPMVFEGPKFLGTYVKITD